MLFWNCDDADDAETAGSNFAFHAGSRNEPEEIEELPRAAIASRASHEKQFARRESLRP
jgi:hypothetical protein